MRQRHARRDGLGIAPAASNSLTAFWPGAARAEITRLRSENRSLRDQLARQLGLQARRVSEGANAETPHLVAAAVQAALQADTPQLPRRRARVLAGDREPLYSTSKPVTRLRKYR